MNATIDPALSEYDRLGHPVAEIVADLGDEDATSPTPLQWTARATPRRAATRSRHIFQVARLLGAALAVWLVLVAVACGDSTSPAPTPPRGVASVSLSPADSTLAIGETVTLAATLRDSAGAPLTGRPLAWGSEGANVATVDANGRVTAVAIGVVRVFATSEGKRGTATITVITARPAVATVTVAADRQRFEPGDTEPLRAIVADAAGRPLEGRAVVWSSTDTSVATVDASGTVTAREAGLVAITATSEGRSGTLRLAVSDPPSADLLYRYAVPDTNAIHVLTMARGSAPTRVPGTPALNRPAPAPDGRRIAFAATVIAPGADWVDDIFVIDRDGTNLRRLTTGEGWDDMPAWSPIPESRLIAYVHRDAATARDDVWVMRDDGTGARNLTADLPADLTRGEPAWSPDGQWIAFTQSGTTGARGGSLWLVRADGAARRELTRNPTGGFDTHPSWSPDGQRIVFARDGLAIVDVTTGAVVRLALPGVAAAPAWSPDGRHIAFAWQSTAPGLGGWDIYTVHPDGSDMRRRVAGATRLGYTVEPAWIGRAQ